MVRNFTLFVLNSPIIDRPSLTSLLLEINSENRQTFLNYLMSHTHQGLNTFLSCLVKHCLVKTVSFIKAAFGFLSTTDLAQMKAKVKVFLNPVSKPMVQLSVATFHFVKPGLN